MAETIGVRPYGGPDGRVAAIQYDGGAEGLSKLKDAFPGRVTAHYSREDAVLVAVNGRLVRVDEGDWVTEDACGTLRTWPGDQFAVLHHPMDATAA